MTVVKWIQALMLTFSLIFIMIFVYLFIANDQYAMFQRNKSGGDGKTVTTRSAPTPRPDTSRMSNQISSEEQVLAPTKYGRVSGFKQKVFSKDVNTFLGIPFARPPVGDLRFKRTVAPLPWGKTLPAKKFKKKCIQIKKKDNPAFTDVSAGMSEDCLYLNVWTTSMNATSLKPVMMWIYGGGFFMGTANFDETDGRVLAAYGDVVVVTFDYRVGGLGFIDLDTEGEAGNQGLYDQAMAMKWIRENIKAFGGDPDKLTLFGESSGAIAIGLHMMSPETKNLFSRAILQSGSPMMTNAFFQRAEKSVPEFVKHLNCLNDGDDDSFSYNLKCLRKKSVEEIIEATEAMHKKYFFAFPPTPGEDFLPMIPTELIKSDDKETELENMKEIMIGTNVKGFSYMLYLANKEIFSRYNVSRTFSNVDEIKDLMRNDIGHLLQMPNFQINFLGNRLFANYTETNKTSSEWLDRLIEVLGDVSFVCPSNILIDEMSALGKDVYVYQFTQESQGSPWGEWFGSTLHDDIPFVFGHPLRHPFKFSGMDIEVSKRMMATWSEFARSGKAMPQLGNEWKKYSSDNQVYINLSFNDSSSGTKLHEDTCKVFKLGIDLLN